MIQLRDSKPIRATLLVALLILLGLNFLFARLSLNTETARMRPAVQDADEVVLSAPVMSALFLNHDEFAADLSWVRAVLYFGERHTRARRVPQLEELAWTATELDPHFYRLYDWYPRVYMRSHYPVTEEVIEEANRFARRGMEYFPERHDLPLAAGMRYLGHSSEAGPERRLREVNRAIEYLKKASMYEEAPENTAFVLSWFYNRRAQLEQKLGEAPEDAASQGEGLAADAREFYLELYATTSNEELRERLADKLLEEGVSRQLLEQRRRAAFGQLRDAYLDDHMSYLPLDLWLAATGGTR